MAYINQFGQVVQTEEDFGAGGLGGMLLGRFISGRMQKQQGGGGRPGLFHRNQPQPQPQPMYIQGPPMVSPYGQPQPQPYYGAQVVPINYGQDLIVPQGGGGSAYGADEYGAAVAFGEDQWAVEGEEEFGALDREEDEADADPDEFNGLKRLNRVYSRRQGKTQKWRSREDNAKTGLGRKLAGGFANRAERKEGNTEDKLKRKMDKLGVVAAGAAGAAGGAAMAGGEIFGAINTMAPAGVARLTPLAFYGMGTATGFAFEDDNPYLSVTIPAGGKTGELTVKVPTLANTIYKLVGLKTALKVSGDITLQVKDLLTEGSGSLFLGSKWNSADLFDVDKVESTMGLRAMPTVESPADLTMKIRAVGAESATAKVSLTALVDILKDNAPQSERNFIRRSPGRYGG